MAIAVWTLQAEADLEAILYYIAKDDGRPKTAAKINDEIREKMGVYAESPEIGHRKTGFPDSLRFCVHKRWVVMYQASPRGIDVLRVVDSARDFGRLFGQ